MKIVESEFTYSEYLDYIERTPVVAGTGDSDKRGDPAWYQTGSLQEAIDLARNGWQAGIDALAPEKDLAVIGNTEVRHDIVGSVVDVGAFLSGSPESMIQFVDMTERDRPRLAVYVHLDYTAGVSGAKAMEFCKTVLRELVKLNVTYSLKLTGVFSAHQNGCRADEFIAIKETEQNLVLNNLAFSFHPSFSRRIAFRFLETKTYLASGYGRPTGQTEYEQLCQEHHKRKNSGSQHLIIPGVDAIGSKWTIENLKVKK